MDRERLAESDLLRSCTIVELDEVLSRSAEVALSAGEVLFDNEDVADAVWVLVDGELVITQDSSGAEVVVDHLGPGAFLGEISLLTRAPAEHRARAKGPAHLVRIPAEAFYDLLKSCRAVSEIVLRTMAERVRRSAQLLQKRERMADLGTLTAGLAHELNNPAAAAKRATTLLREHFDALVPLSRRLAERQWSAGEVELLQQLEAATLRIDPAALELDALTRSDREESVGNWLNGRGIERPWTLAPVLVDRGLTADALELLMCDCNPTAVADALAWAERVTTIRQLLDEVGESTSRIAQVVKAVKAYSYTDTTTLRNADVHESIEHSLTILGHKLRDAKANIVRAYDRTLPPIAMYGTELGQVWTNLLDNAADAVAGNTPRGGKVYVRTARDGDAIVVEVADAGPGIDAGVVSKIFDPFFTTKEAGKGTGLGLEIVKRIVSRHHGSVTAWSRPVSAEAPGETRFTVRLPFVQPAESSSGAAGVGASDPAASLQSGAATASATPRATPPSEAPSR
jgi:signal transduction histidine kinase